MFFRGITLLCLCVIFSGGLAQEQCQSLLQAETTYPQCSSLGDCTGMTCTDSTSGVSATFVVNKCTDPLVVNVTVVSGGSTGYFLPTAIGAQELTNGGLTVNFIVTRNASTVLVQASIGSISIIPQIAVPLNQTACMCQTITNVANLLPSGSTIETSCYINQQCTGIDCGVTIAFATFYVETDIQACESPPGILLIVRDSNFQPLFEGYYVTSTTVSVPITSIFSIPVNIIITQKSYSMNIEIAVSLSTGPIVQSYTIISPAQIIVDKTQCSASAPPFVPAPSSEVVSDATCNIITDLTTNSQNSKYLNCYKKPFCDGMTCHLSNYYTTDIQVLACSVPARFYVKMTSLDTTLYSGILTESINVDLQTYGQLQILIVDYGDEISIEVDIYTGLFTVSLPLSLNLRIPKDYCLCSTANCPVTSLPTVPSDTQSSNLDPGIAAAVIVPLFLLILVVILVLAGIIMMLIWRQRRIGFTFSKMTNQEPTPLETFKQSSEAAEPSKEESTDSK